MQKNPLVEVCSFRLTRALISGETRFCDKLIFPVHTGPYGPPLAGFAVSWLLRKVIKAGRDGFASHKRGV